MCKELRQKIIDELSCNPGHFGSSLGVIELTVALHYVFNTPYDRIVWDVGHQAYGHKILTGRRDAFCTNRKLNGIRPFPSPSESEYDTFTCGHASNSISAALGMAVAAKKHGENNRHVVAVIGDGSMSGGLAFEGLNYMMSKMTTSGATGYFVEYAGEAVRSLTMEGRLTLCNLSIEMGARGGMVAPDETTFEYIKGREYAPYTQMQNRMRHIKHWRNWKNLAN